MRRRGHRRISQDCLRRYGSPHAKEPARRSREKATSTLVPAENRPERAPLARQPIRLARPTVDWRFSDIDERLSKDRTAPECPDPQFLEVRIAQR